MVKAVNWIEIDKILYRIIGRHDTVDAIYSEAQKTFKWDMDQARTAIDPLLKRHGTLKPVETPKTTTRRKLK
jgi:hypothetical protein